MIESVIVAVVVAGAAAFAGRKMFRTRRAKGHSAGPEAGCSCPGCPTGKKDSCGAARADAHRT